jgi:hypothetical protein
METAANLTAGANGTAFSSPQSFNIYDLLAITINSTYFLFGFPTNLLSIIVCLVSLCSKSTARKSVKLKNNIRLPLRDQNQNRLLKNDAGAAAPLLSVNKENRNATGDQLPNQQIDTNRIEILPPPKRENQRPQPIIQAVQRPKKSPHSRVFEMYLIEISFCDLVILGYNFIEVALLVWSRWGVIDSKYEEIVLISKFTCHFVIALNRTVILMHNWLIAAMAATRCYALYKPLSANLNFSPKFYLRLNLSTLLILLCLFVSLNVYGVSLLSYTDRDAPRDAQCHISAEIYKSYPRVDFYINLSLGIIGYSLPCLITLVINLVLIYNMRKVGLLRIKKYSTNNEDEGDGDNANASSNANNNVLQKATFTLLTLSFSYLICYVPYTVAYVLLSLDAVQMNGDVFFALSQLRALNHTLNFYIYFFTGKRFRRDVLDLLTFKRK